MPNVVVAIAVEAYYFVAATLAKGGIGAFLLRAGGSTLLSVATSKLFAPKIPAEQIGLVSQQVMVRSGIEHRTIGYGQVVTSGPVVYNNVQGTNNEYVWSQVAMLDGDWPRIRAEYERWLDPSNFEADGTQKSKLQLR